MKKNYSLRLALSATSFLLGSVSAFADSDAKGPCAQIKQACLDAKFVPGAAKDGKGLWVDCVANIMGNPKAGKASIALPSVDATVVSQCKAKNPNFGQGKRK